MEQNTPNYEMEMMTIDLQKYALLLWHWAWLIILAGVLAGGSAFLISRNLQPVYEAETTVLVDQGASAAGNEYQSILMSERLTQTYADLLTQRPVLESVVEQLELNVEIEDFQEIITVSPLRDTLLITIAVEHQSPYQAARIANSLVEVFIQQNAERQSTRYASSKKNLKTQLDQVDSDIEAVNQGLEALKVGGNEEERNRLELTLSQYRSTYSSLLQSYEEVRMAEAESISSIIQVEPATPPLEPVRPRTLVNTALAVVMGGMLAVGGVFLLEALDDTISDPEQIKRLLQYPILGMIPQHPPGEQDIISIEQPRHPAVEAFRALRTNIKYTSVDQPIRKILVTSAGQDVGKTSVIANLAVVLAQGGNKVILVDCDLRKPKIHRRLGNANHQGLSDSFLEDKDNLSDLIQIHQKVDNLAVLSSGTIPPNPAELLGSEKMRSMLADLEKDYDYILLDSPPLMAVTDAAVLSQAVDGVLLVVKPGQTKTGALKSAVEQLGHVHSKILGLVLNEIPRHGSRYYRQIYQYYTYQEYQSEDE